MLRPYRGCRAGSKIKAKSRCYNAIIPSIIMGNIRLLGNKMEEFTALIRTQREYWEYSVLCFTVIWLHCVILDSNASTTGLQTVRADRDAELSGKKKGGVIALFVTNRWCNKGHVTVKEHQCCPNIRLLAVGLRPYYLPKAYICHCDYCLHTTSSRHRSSM